MSRRRSGLIGTATAALLVCGLMACSSSGSTSTSAPTGTQTGSATAQTSMPPLSVTAANLQDVRPLVASRGLTRSVSVDDRALVLSPSDVDGPVSEQTALDLWDQGRGGSRPSTMLVAHVVATVAAPIPAPVRMASPAPLTFRQVPAWAVIALGDEATYNCPALSPTTTSPTYPGSQDITLVADDGSGRVVTFTTRGSRPCSPTVRTGPTTRFSPLAYSAPWVLERSGVPAPRRAGRVGDLIRYALEPCSSLTGTGQRGISATQDEYRVDAVAFRLGADRRCLTPRTGTVFATRDPGKDAPAHAPTGPVTGPSPRPPVVDGSADPPSSALSTP